MTLSVIIPSYNRPNDLDRLLESINNQILQPKEILVVLGPNDVKSVIVLQKWKTKMLTLQVINACKKSLVHSLNLGLSAAREDIICLLDDDVWLPPTWSQIITSSFISDETLGAFGGRDIIQSEELLLKNPLLSQSVGLFFWNGTVTGNHHCGALVSPTLVDVLKGVNLSFRRTALIPLKIDSALEGYGAETCTEIDICMRIQRNGFRIIYDNDNYVLHYISPRIESDSRTDLLAASRLNNIYNYAYVHAKFRPLYEIFFSFTRSFLIGSRLNPGLVWSFLLVKKYGYSVVIFPLHSIRFYLKGIIHGFRSRFLSP